MVAITPNKLDEKNMELRTEKRITKKNCPVSFILEFAIFHSVVNEENRPIRQQWQLYPRERSPSCLRGWPSWPDTFV